MYRNGSRAVVLFCLITIYQETFTRRKFFPISPPVTSKIIFYSFYIEDVVTFTILAKIKSVKCSCDTKLIMYASFLLWKLSALQSFNLCWYKVGGTGISHSLPSTCAAFDSNPPKSGTLCVSIMTWSILCTRLSVCSQNSCRIRMATLLWTQRVEVDMLKQQGYY